MKNNKTTVAHPPAFTQSALWSWNLNDLELKRDKKLIISQILNYGNFSTWQWLFKTYPKKAIVNCILNPRRGSWWPKRINYWLAIFGKKLPADVYKKAIINMNSIP